MSLSNHLRLSRAAVLCLCVTLGACGGRDGDAPEPKAAAPSSARPAPAAVTLQDVLETTPTHVIGISYPKELAKYPGLAQHAQRYAEQARQQLVSAVKQKPADPAAGPFELSLEFKLRHESPQLVVLAVDGSSYTGGAHGTPMIQRWVWLPPSNRMLTAGDLFPAQDSWKAISTDVRTRLRESVSRRLDEDKVAAAERAEVVRVTDAMIEGGTESQPGDFAVFEPVMTADGKISALRFVFPPYQVGTYADGMHTVEVPAAELVAMVDPAYRSLFQA